MENRMLQATRSKQSASLRVRQINHLLCALFSLVIITIPAIGRAQVAEQSRPTGANPIPEPAIPAILAAFDKYEVVGIDAAHGMKDVDDFILTLIRNPAFSEKVNDIAVECGNSLYQAALDRYIAGEDVPFTEARKAWRNTSQFMCSTSAFFEQLFALVSDLGTFDTDSPTLSSGPFVSWPIASFARAKGTWLGALDLSQFLPPGLSIDSDCNVHIVISKSMQRPMEDFVDAFLYFGPQDLRLKEQMPADIASDTDFITELQRREAMSGFSMIGTLKDFDQRILSSAENPLLAFKQADTKLIAKRCLDRKAQSSTPK